MQRDERRGDNVGALAATTFGLCGLAITVPLLTILGSASTFFTAHAVERSDVLVFTAALAIVPSAGVFMMLSLARLAGQPRRDLLTDTFVGILLAAAIVPSVDRTVGLGTYSFLALTLVLASAVAVLHRQRSEVRTFVRLTAIAPVVVIAWFLLLSSVSGLVLPQPAVGAPRAGSDANVLVLIFDELPTAVLLDDAGDIDRERFPAFADLSRRGTWYPKATTVAPWTHLAVPAILSGLMPEPQAKASHYARNLFTMLEETHDLVAKELVTRLCRSQACTDEVPDIGRLFDDAFVVYSHASLPDGLAERWFPGLEDRWSDLRARSDRDDQLIVKPDKSDPIAAFGELSDSVETHRPGRPTAWVAHLRLPHFPLSYLPDGRLYTKQKPRGLTPRSGRWGSAQPAIDAARQRFVLQVMYADTLVGELIGMLERNDAFDETMVVVTSDHGLTFQPGHRRGVPHSADTAPDIAPVPLFIKYPEQRAGSVDDRSAQVIDIVPTIADALGVDLPGSWSFDGRSLLGADPGSPRAARYIDEGREIEIPPDVLEIAPAVQNYRNLIGERRDAHDIYAWGPHRELVGERPEALRTRASDASVRLTTRDLMSYDPESELTPALVELRFDRSPASDWIAVALNGTIAGLGRSYEDKHGHIGSAMIDPAFLRPGKNEVEAFFVGPRGELSRVELSFPRE